VVNLSELLMSLAARITLQGVLTDTARPLFTHYKAY
jgi:hypothetical protein